MDIEREPKDTSETRHLLNGSGAVGNFMDPITRPLLQSPVKSTVALLLFVFLLVGMFFSNGFHPIAISGFSGPKPTLSTKKPQRKLEIPLNCDAHHLNGTCPPDYPTTFTGHTYRPSSDTCPEYFRWIYEDLRPWAVTGISRDMVERAKKTAHFRLVIMNGKAYLETFDKAFQTRDVFTLWGILQLLRRYPGRLPDLEMMFNCNDWPAIRSVDYTGPHSKSPPPLFHYCGNDETVDIVFPDWSFWGWVELNIKPWDQILKDLKEGNERRKWKEREPYAYWKGNPHVAERRKDLMKCNISQEHDWNARLYTQDWIKESKQGFNQSNLADQCTHRYKIYIEGNAWSVSEKYILACDSVTFFVTTHFYDFFTRGLMPVHHYWPIREDDKCRSIKYAVDWGNNHSQEAQTIGKAASDFIQEELKLDYVYDYMFHVLNEYSKLLKFKPTIPRNATELCSEKMACSAEELTKKYMNESLVKRPAYTNPCAMPPPYEPASLYELRSLKLNAIKQVESLERNYFRKRKRNLEEDSIVPKPSRKGS